MRRKVLVLADYYPPARMGGGAMRSLESQIATLGTECEYHVITRDHDLGDRRTFDGVLQGAWNPVGTAQIYYAHSGIHAMSVFWRALKQFAPDFVYLGSVVAIWYSIVPIVLLRLSRWFRGGSGTQLVIAPRGQFGAGALNVKPVRKRLYLALSRLIGFHSGVLWHASSRREADEIIHWIGNRARIKIALDIWKPTLTAPATVEKSRGAARIVYVSRISPEKNLLVAIRMLARVSGTVDFLIFGPVLSASYWADCRKELARLPQNVRSQYGGQLSAEQVFSAFGDAHLFLLPTPGENFGHVILEALSAGCPVLISDRTPWGAVAEFGGGWVESLDQPQQFADRIEQLVDMESVQWAAMSRRAREFSELHGERPESVLENRALFDL